MLAKAISDRLCRMTRLFEPCALHRMVMASKWIEIRGKGGLDSSEHFPAVGAMREATGSIECQP
jgi:hypothetical protein